MSNIVAIVFANTQDAKSARRDLPGFALHTEEVVVVPSLAVTRARETNFSVQRK